jgi:serine/threonine protein kinase
MSSSDPTLQRQSPSGSSSEDFDPTDETSTGSTAVRMDSDALVRADDIPAQLGEILGGYKIESVLGKGGMGCVYLGRHEILKREAAVKVLATHLSGDQGYVSRFFHEAQIVNEVNHPNIVEIMDFVQTKEPLRVAYVMEVLKGQPLSSLVNTHSLSMQQTMNLCFQLCDALVAVHKKGVVHRDLKPENIFVIEPPDSDFSYVPSVKILDFGIAKKQTGNVSHQTATGAIIGTPAYMAPEQISGQGVADKTDVYAMGEILYEMLTGERLFSGENMDIMKSKLIHEVPQFSLPDTIEECERLTILLSWALTQDPKKRPTMLQFARSVLEFCPNMITPRASSSAALLNPELLLETPVPTALSGPITPLNTGAVHSLEKKGQRILPLFLAGILTVSGLGYALIQNNPMPVSGTATGSSKKVPIAAPPKVEAPKVAKPATASVKVWSEPSGARVIDVASSSLLGQTPVLVQVTKGRDRKIRLELEAYDNLVNYLSFDDKERGFVLKEKKKLRAVQPPKPTPQIKPSPKQPTPKPNPAKKVPVKADDPFSKREVPEW